MRERIRKKPTELISKSGSNCARNMPKPTSVWRECLSELGRHVDGALKAVPNARRREKFVPFMLKRPPSKAEFIEMSVNEEKAIASFQALRSPKGKTFSPKRLTGLGLIYKERAEACGGERRFSSRKKQIMPKSGKYLQICDSNQLSGAHLTRK